MRRVLVTGSRDWRDDDAVFEALEEQRAKSPEGMVVVHGDARGADQLAKAWAKLTPRVMEESHPYIAGMGKLGGPMRNQQMVNLGADVCIAFILPGSTGTWDCVRRANAAGIPVIEVGPRPQPPEDYEHAVVTALRINARRPHADGSHTEGQPSCPSARGVEPCTCGKHEAQLALDLLLRPGSPSAEVEARQVQLAQEGRRR